MERKAREITMQASIHGGAERRREIMMQASIHDTECQFIRIAKENAVPTAA